MKTTTMEETMPARVPRLRFPEFQDSHGWDRMPLARVCNVLQGYGFPEAIQGKANGKYPFCKVSDISKAVAENAGVLAEAANYVDDAEVGMLRAKPIPPGATVFAKIGEALRLNRRAYVLNSCLIDNNAVALKGIDGLANDYFVYLLSQLIDLNNHCGGAVPSVNKTTLEQIQVCVPSLTEQKKIAECLSSVDELMAAQARKVDALKAHKKGLMQQLFPREGETQPRLRFPEFQNAGEWEAAPMGTLLRSSPDYGVNAAAVPFSEQLPKYLRITDISEDGRYLPEKQVSVDLEATDGNYLDEGDIVLARTGASVGKSYQYREEDGRLVFAGFLIRVKPHPKKLVSTYLANFLTTGQFWKWVAVTSARSGQPGINSTEYSSLTIPLPPTLPEQQRIASCLSSLDALITAETQKLEALKTHKKGLMQQLFPSVGGVPEGRGGSLSVGGVAGEA